MPIPSEYPPGVTGMEPQIAGYPECDCGDDCEKVGTDCCDYQFACETVTGGGGCCSDDDRIVVCATGFGCAVNPDQYLQTEAEGLDLLAREEYETSP